jgi:hypothetical protein
MGLSRLCGICGAAFQRLGLSLASVGKSLYLNQYSEEILSESQIRQSSLQNLVVTFCSRMTHQQCSFSCGTAFPPHMLTMVPRCHSLIILLPVCVAFRHTADPTHRGGCALFRLDAHTNRRSLFQTIGWTTAIATAQTSCTTVSPAWAGIDVSGLRSADPGNNNNAIAAQLRAFDGSGAARVQQLSTSERRPPPPSTTTPVAEFSTTIDPSTSSTAATYAYRYAPGFAPKLSKAGRYGELLQCDDQLVSPTGQGYLSVSFQFPADWLQLDRILGGIQYVDQRNGDKLYILQAKVPEGSTVATVPKSFFGNAIFDPQGTLIRNGINVDEYKVKSSVVLSDGSVSAPHRRLLLKYATVTGNGLRTERRALVDAYQIESVAYLLMTSSNAVKFDANGRERDTVEAIVNSFRMEQIR